MNISKTEDNQLPQSILTKLFDCTGSTSGANKGFILFYINEFGNPTVTTKSDNMCVDMALAKLVELFCTKEVDND